MALPIRIRLSISYFAIFSVAGILLCASAYLMARRSLYLALEHELDEHVDDVRNYLQTRGTATPADLSAQVEAEFAVKDNGKWLQIQEDGRDWIYRSGHMLIVPHGLPAPNSLPRQGLFTQFPVAEKTVRALVRSFSVNGHTFVVESGITLNRADQTLVDFRNGLLLISPAVFLMAGLAGHFVSRRALAPVAAIAREAQRIHDGNLQSRLPQLSTRDELAHLSATLNEMLERIESGVRSVRDFTAYASHELRTPLALIRTETDLALHFVRSPEEYREALGAIGGEAVRMSVLLDSLLFLARADAGAEQVIFEQVDAARLTRQACDKWLRTQPEGRLRLQLDLPESPLPVMADPNYLHRLLTIILENAGKYTPEGGRVTVSVNVQDRMAEFAVEDTGIGILPQDQRHIFERFFRGGNVQQAQASGSGLGLALAAWIAARHQTRIEVSSEPGHGSSFRWRLGLAESALRSQQLVSEPLGLQTR